MNTFEATKNFLDAKELHYKVMEENKAMKMSFGGLDNKESIEVMIFFDEDNKSIGIRCWGFCKVPETKFDKIFAVCSAMNKEYRWVKYYIDEEDKTVDVSIDAVVNIETCGAIVDELVQRLVSICDDVYPEFMKALWA